MTRKLSRFRRSRWQRGRSRGAHRPVTWTACTCSPNRGSSARQLRRGTSSRRTPSRWRGTPVTCESSFGRPSVPWGSRSRSTRRRGTPLGSSCGPIAAAPMTSRLVARWTGRRWSRRTGGQSRWAGRRARWRRAAWLSPWGRSASSPGPTGSSRVSHGASRARYRRWSQARRDGRRCRAGGRSGHHAGSAWDTRPGWKGASDRCAGPKGRATPSLPRRV